MRTVTYKSVRDLTATLLGLDPDGLLPNIEASIARYLQLRAQEAWELADWPEWCPIEKRYFHNPYSESATYQEGDIVFFEDAYYQAIQETIDNSPDDTDYWEQVTTDPYIALDQSGHTRMHDVVAIWKDDPRKTISPIPVAWFLDMEGIWIQGESCLPFVWVQFRKASPEYSSKVYQSNTTYRQGEVVYYEGDCYKALGDTTAINPLDPSTWQYQPVPQALSRFMAHGAHANLLREDGQDDHASFAESQASAALHQALLKISTAIGRFQRFTAIA